jgi:hypothetical protein
VLFHFPCCYIKNQRPASASARTPPPASSACLLRRGQRAANSEQRMSLCPLCTPPVSASLSLSPYPSISLSLYLSMHLSIPGRRSRQPPPPPFAVGRRNPNSSRQMLFSLRTSFRVSGCCYCHRIRYLLAPGASNALVSRRDKNARGARALFALCALEVEIPQSQLAVSGYPHLALLSFSQHTRGLRLGTFGRDRRE